MNVEQCWILLLYGWVSFFLTRVKILLSGCPGTGRIQPLGDLLLEVVIKKTPINLGFYNLTTFATFFSKIYLKVFLMDRIFSIGPIKGCLGCKVVRD
jgi:hypothetical protein